MKLTTTSFVDRQVMPSELALGVIDLDKHVALSDNLNPDFAWSELPAGTRSLALVCVDPDAPSIGTDVNQPGRVVSASLPRADFHHWALIDLPVDSRPIERGEFSAKVTPRGKGGPAFARLDGTLVRQAINDYTGWFAGDSDMGGDWYGYDGPCPPWNDALVHRYVFTLYALDIGQLPIAAAGAGRFTAPDVLAAIRPHVLGQASLTGVYTLNPSLDPIAPAAGA
ncbi:YbhB/YbcL family Raf kinase inhibitor-like protein [soil metagenome]